MKVCGKPRTFWVGFFLYPKHRSHHGVRPAIRLDFRNAGRRLVVGGLCALGAGLYSIGMPKNSVVKYETALKSDKFLAIDHGTADEVAKAKSFLETTGESEIAAHHGVLLPMVTVAGVAGRA